MLDHKFNVSERPAQALIAGITKKDNNIEFFGIHETMEVRYLQNGKTHKFKELSGANAVAVVEAFEEDKKAKEILKNLKAADGTPANLSPSRMLELYIYYCYGALDSTPDMVDGVLSKPENYRHRRDCISLQFSRKILRINGQPMKPREIIMLDSFADDNVDEVTADKLCITLTTLNQHKKELFNRAGVFTKTGLMIQAYANGLVML